MIAPVFGRTPRAPTPVSGLRAEALAHMTGDVTDAIALAGGAHWRLDPRTTRPDVLAFDGGKVTGWARISGLEGHKSGDIERASTSIDRAFCARVGWLLDAFAELGRSNVLGAAGRVVGRTIGAPRLVVVEDCFLGAQGKEGFRGPRNVAVTKGLAFGIGALIGLAAERGLPVWRVMPISWQSALLGKTLRAQGKAVSLSRARHHFGEHIATDHEADASLLALWARGGFLPVQKKKAGST